MTAIAPDTLAALLREERELMADQRRLADQMNSYSMKMSYAVGHTDDDTYQSFLQQVRHNTERIQLIQAVLKPAAQ